MATESLVNKISDFGGPVYGERFIGREKEIRQIESRVLGESFGNIAIMGLPRIGKSSLAWQAIMTKKDELNSKNIFPIYYSIGSCMSSFEFFMHLVTLCDEELSLFLQNNETITATFPKEKYERIIPQLATEIKQETDYLCVRDCCKKYFKYIKHLNIRIIFILDEFDSAQKIFNVADFQLLRELSYDPDTKLCLVTCSRKTIQDIEAKNGALSNFYGIFKDIRLSMFTNDDVNSYWRRLKVYKELPEQYKTDAKYYVGGHPFLLDYYNYNILVNDVSDVDEIKLELMIQYDSIVNTLENEGLLNAAIQLVVGPLYDVSQKQLESLLKYGYLTECTEDKKKELFWSNYDGPSFGDKHYNCFSSYCTLDLYRRYYANIPYVKLWADTENKLRAIVIEYLSQKYSCDWEIDMEAYLRTHLPHKTFDVTKWVGNVGSLRSNMKKMTTDFPNMRGMHIVNFALTSQLFDIFIRPDWTWFANVFRGNYTDWNNKFSFLTKIRNPIAHNNNGISETDTGVATTYCKEISAAIDEWFKSNSIKQ